MYRIEINETSDKQFIILLKSAKNGQVVLQSETYASKSNARRAAKRIGKGLNVEVT